MMRSLFSGVSGLKNHQTRMDVIGNNISNVNTTGFKSSRVTFVDTLQQTLTGASAPTENLGGTNPKQIGLGSGVGSIDMIMTDGNVQPTGKNTDLCLSGNGYFIVKKGNDVYYTRDGAFEFDAAGNYVLPGSGLYVQGVMATDGVLPQSIPGDPKSLQNIVVQAGKQMAATASTEATFTNNLNASMPTIVSMTVSYEGTTATKTYDTITDPDNPKFIQLGVADPDFTPPPSPPGGTNTVSSVSYKLSDGNTYTEMYDDTKENHDKFTLGTSDRLSTVVTVYDSLGNAHDIPVYFSKTKVSSADGNTWTVSVTKDGTSTNKIVEEDGSITEIDMGAIELKFDTNGEFKDGPGQIVMTLNNGATTGQKINVLLNTLTQYAGSSTIATHSDGNKAGTLSSISIDSTGVITGSYTNGINQAEAQIALAQFNNPSGLTKTGTSLYKDSNNSGTANVKDAAALGVTITPSALEMSNVDLANEFSDMIITQRGFQSNSKIITVSDEMLETLVNMKR